MSDNTPSRNNPSKPGEGYELFDSLSPPGEPSQGESGEFGTWDTFGAVATTPATAEVENRSKKGKPKGAVQQEPAAADTQQQSKKSRSFFKALTKKMPSKTSHASNEKGVGQRPEQKPFDTSQSKGDEFHKQKQNLKPSERSEDMSFLRSKDQYSDATRIKPELAKVQDSSDPKRAMLHADIESISEHMQQKMVDLERDLSDAKKDQQKYEDLFKKLEDKLQHCQSERKNKEEDMQTLVDELQAKNGDLSQQLNEESVQFERMKKKLEETQRLKDEIGHLKLDYDQIDQKNLELSCRIDTLKEDAEAKMKDKEAELKASRDQLDDRTKEVIALYKEREEKSKVAWDQEKELLSTKAEVDKYDKVCRKLKALTDDKNIWDTKEKEYQVKLEEEEKLSASSKKDLEKTRERLREKELEIKMQCAESQKLDAINRELRIKFDKFQTDHQNLLRTLELEKNQIILKHGEEMKSIKEKTAQLVLEETYAKCQILMQKVPPFAEQHGGVAEIVASPEHNILRIKNELGLLIPPDANLPSSLGKSKSLVEFQSGGSEQVKREISMHSSAPSSLTKEPSIDSTNQEYAVYATELKWQVGDGLNIPCESPHTSLTQVARKVTVSFGQFDVLCLYLWGY